MAIAFDGTRVPDKLKPLPCGGIPVFDHESGYSYRCDACFAVIGSISMPKNCKEYYEEAKKRGDYNEEN